MDLEELHGQIIDLLRESAMPGGPPYAETASKIIGILDGYRQDSLRIAVREVVAEMGAVPVFYDVVHDTRRAVTQADVDEWQKTLGVFWKLRHHLRKLGDTRSSEQVEAVMAQAAD